MATLAKDKPRVFELTGAHPDYNEIPIIADDIVYAGAAVGESTTTGTGRPLNGADAFMGFCVEKCDNTGGSANDKQIKVLSTGYAELVVTGVDNINDEGASVYASDDDTFTLTSTTTSTQIGKVVRVTSTALNKALVYFEAAHRRSI